MRESFLKTLYVAHILSCMIFEWLLDSGIRIENTMFLRVEYCFGSLTELNQYF